MDFRKEFFLCEWFENCETQPTATGSADIEKGLTLILNEEGFIGETAPPQEHLWLNSGVCVCGEGAREVSTSGNTCAFEGTSDGFG